MFSFHKPKVYRSTQGCCICKAKSSSSRFTDSAKYELDFIECFQLEVARQGEICNACVLLVKRFKRLPPGSDRHWGHVVDARVGPGLKSMSKFKKRKEEQLAQKLLHEEQQKQQQITTVSACGEKFGKIYRKTKKPAKAPVTAEARSEDDGDAGGASCPSNGSSDEIATSPAHPLSDAEPMATESTLFCHETLGDDMLPPSGPASPAPAGTSSPVQQALPIATTTIKPTAKITRRKSTTATTFAVRRIVRKSARPVRNNRNGIRDGCDRKTLLLAADCGWQERRTCCGVVYEHQLIGAVLLDAETPLLRQSCVHHGRRSAATATEDAAAMETGLDRLLRAADSPDAATATASQLSAAPAAAAAAAPAAKAPPAATAAAPSPDISSQLTAAIPPPEASSTVLSTGAAAVGRKIKLTQNALQFLRKTARERALSSAAAAIATATATPATSASAPPSTTVSSASAQLSPTSALAQPAAGNNLLGKFVTITGKQLAKTTVAVAAATTSAAAGVVSHEVTGGHKFNDNSSDSGYDEGTMLGDSNGPKATDASVTTIMQQIVLANGMKLNVKPMPPSMSKKIIILPKTSQQLAAGKTISVLTANGSAKLQELLQKQQQLQLQQQLQQQQQQQQSKSPGAAD